MLAMGDAYYVDKKPFCAGDWFEKAAKIGNQFLEATNPNLLHYGSRTQIRLSVYLMSLDNYKRAIYFLLKSLDSLSFELNLRFNPIVAPSRLSGFNKDEKKQGKKLSYKIERVIKYTGLVYALLSHCFEKENRFDKTLECSRNAVNILSFIDKENDTMYIRFQKLHLDNEERLKRTVSEGKEFQRVITFLHRRYETWPEPEYTFQEEQRLVFIRQCREKMYKKLELDNPREKSPIWVLPPLDIESDGSDNEPLRAVQKDNARKALEKMKSKSFDNPKELILSDPGHKKKSKKKVVLNWNDPNNNYMYEHSIREKFRPDVFMSFNDYQKVKEEKKKTLDLDQLKSDRFWYIRDKKIDKYDPDKKERELEKKKLKEKDLQDKIELQKYIAAQKDDKTFEGKASTSYCSFNLSKMERQNDGEETISQGQNSKGLKPQDISPNKNQSYGEFFNLDQTNLLERYLVKKPAFLEKRKQSAPKESRTREVIQETKAMDHYFKNHINRESTSNPRIRVRKTNIVGKSGNPSIHTIEVDQDNESQRKESPTNIRLSQKAIRKKVLFPITTKDEAAIIPGETINQQTFNFNMNKESFNPMKGKQIIQDNSFIKMQKKRMNEQQNIRNDNSFEE